MTGPLRADVRILDRYLAGEHPALRDLFRCAADEDGSGGRFVATGARPSFAPRLRSALLRLPPELFGGRRE